MYYVLSYQYVYYPTTHLNLYQSEYCLKESFLTFLPYSVQLYVVIVDSFCMKKHGSTQLNLEYKLYAVVATAFYVYVKKNKFKESDHR